MSVKCAACAKKLAASLSVPVLERAPCAHHCVLGVLERAERHWRLREASPSSSSFSSAVPQERMVELSPQVRAERVAAVPGAGVRAWTR